MVLSSRHDMQDDADDEIAEREGIVVMCDVDVLLPIIYCFEKEGCRQRVEDRRG